MVCFEIHERTYLSVSAPASVSSLGGSDRSERSAPVSGCMSDAKPSSLMLMSTYSSRVTATIHRVKQGAVAWELLVRLPSGATAVCELGQNATCLLAQNTSSPVTFTLEWPCFPDFDLVTSTICSGNEHSLVFGKSSQALRLEAPAHNVEHS